MSQVWAQTSYNDLVKFMAEVGDEDFKYRLENAPSYVTYLSDSTAFELININGNFLENRLLNSVLSYFALLADESTDDGNHDSFC